MGDEPVRSPVRALLVPSEPMHVHRSLRIALLPLLCSRACTDGERSSKPEVELRGRVFSADTGRPVRDSAVAVPGGKEASTDELGAFKVRYPEKDGGVVRVESDKAAPVSKLAPKNGGYVELHVKEYDAQEQILSSEGGAVSSKDGARLAVG